MYNISSSELNDEKSNNFNILLDGYEGPIDLLLELAKKQKVDLSNISILNLAEQYLDFIQKFKELHLEIAADYLVMAAWLTYLKSRLLLPKNEIEDENTPEELEEALKFQLQRLESMQNISKILYARPLIGRDVFYSGTSDNIKKRYTIKYFSSLYDLLKTYVYFINNETINTLTISFSELYSVDSAIKRLMRMFGSIKEWVDFINLIPIMGKSSLINKSSIASNFVASLELVKNGIIEVKQNKTFGNIFLKAK